MFREHLKENKIDEEVRVLDTEDLIKNQFEILSEEDDEEIDIDKIKELYEWVTRRNGEVTQTEGKIIEIGNKLNEVIKAIKQLNKKIKE